jgi:queuine tRNA-ribosyltransferase
VSLTFQLQRTSGSARLGTLTTPHGPVETPVFMPVGTLATVKGIPQHFLEELGAQIILSNTYHLYLRPGTGQIRALGGLHRFMSWDGAILTDSGGFQVFSLNELRKVSEEGVRFRSHLDGSSHMFTPESAIEAQIALGADIIMAFDECTEYPADRARAQQSMELTVRWAARSKAAFEKNKYNVPWSAASRDDAKKPRALDRQSEADEESRTKVDKQETSPRDESVSGLLTGAENLSGLAAGRGPMAEGIAHRQDLTQSLFGIVQGGMYTDLRIECAKRLVDMDFPGYAIGGLSVGEPRPLTREVIEATLEHLPKDKPRYVMGVGYPDEIVEYAALGVDMMDCVLPTRAARHALLFTSQGRINIKNARYAQDQAPPDPECQCWVCARYTRAYLRHLFVTGESLGGVLNTVHNLAYYLETMRRVRYAIQLGNVSEMVARVRAQQKHATTRVE